MADTREFYLVCNDGTIFGSDPKTIYKYLDISDEGDLNDKASTVIYNFKNQFRVIGDYEIELTLTFNNRAERELFAMTNIDNIWAFGATGKVDKSVIYTKRAMVAGFEFIDNTYTNGIQSVLTLKVSGQWQSDITQYTVPSPDDNGDGTKKYYAGELYETAKDSAVGTNLGLNTSDFSQNWSGYSSISTSVEYNGYPSLQFNSTSSAMKLASQAYTGTQADTTYTISFYAKADSAGDKAHSEFFGSIGATDKTLTTDWVRYSVTVKSRTDATSTSSNRWYVGAPKGNTGTIYIALPKLEEGSTATPWLPNISDANYSYLCEATYQYKLVAENLNVYKYGSTNYSNQIQLDIEDNQFLIYFVLNEGENQVTIANDTDSVTLTHTAFSNGELVPLGSEGIDYSLDSRDTVDAFSLWKDGTLLSDDWTVSSVEDYFTLLSILDTIKESAVSIIAQGPEGATLPYTIYTYSKHDFI